MGADAYMETYVGFEIFESELWTYETDKEATCPKGHAQPSDAPAFCGQCGGKFQRQKVKKPTEGLLRLLTRLEVTVDPLSLPAYELRELGIGVTVDKVAGEAEPSHIAVAKQLSSVASNRFGSNTPESITKEELLKVFATVEQYREDLLGETSRAVQLFSVVQWC